MGLEPNTKYTFQLVAINDHGEAAGPWVEVKTAGTGMYGLFVCLFV